MLGILGNIAVAEKLVDQTLKMDGGEKTFAPLIDMKPEAIKKAALCWLVLKDRAVDASGDSVGKNAGGQKKLPGLR